MAKKPPWEIRVGRKTQVLAEFNLPAHKLDRKGLEDFLRAVVVRYRTDGPEEMVNYYVNRRRGKPTRLPFADTRYCWDFDRRRVGRFCGDWECYAVAVQEIDEAVARALRKFHEQNKNATHLGTR